MCASDTSHISSLTNHTVHSNQYLMSRCLESKHPHTSIIYSFRRWGVEQGTLKWHTESLMCSGCHGWEVCPVVTLIRRLCLCWSHQLFISPALVWGPKLQGLHLVLPELTVSSSWRRELSRSSTFCSVLWLFDAFDGCSRMGFSVSFWFSGCNYWPLPLFFSLIPTIIYLPSLVSSSTFFLGGGSV